MPTSSYNNIPPILAEVRRLQPKSILDLGIGWGKYGMLCREYLEVPEGRYLREQWQLKMIGVEGFPAYRTSAWGFYDEIRIENFSEHFESYKGFDIVLMLDSLEHLDKETGLRILDALRKNNKAVIVSVPEGESSQESWCGNDLERHLSTWTADELESLGGVAFMKFICSGVIFESDPC
jgi:hypothetical protein